MLLSVINSYYETGEFITSITYVTFQNKHCSLLYTVTGFQVPFDYSADSSLSEPLSDSITVSVREWSRALSALRSFRHQSV